MLKNWYEKLGHGLGQLRKVNVTSAKTVDELKILLDRHGDREMYLF
jgi:hypothetical protein